MKHGRDSKKKSERKRKGKKRGQKKTEKKKKKKKNERKKNVGIAMKLDFHLPVTLFPLRVLSSFRSNEIIKLKQGTRKVITSFMQHPLH